MGFAADELGSFARGLQDFSNQLDLSFEPKAPVCFPEIATTSSKQDKEKALNESLEILSSLDPQDALDETSLRRSVDFFVALYGGDYSFRHMYSSVCSIMYGYFRDDTELDSGVPPQAQALANNLEMIERFMADDSRFDQEVLGSFSKLHDHVELENNRMKYMAKQNSINADKARQLNKKMDGYEKTINETQTRLEGIGEKITETQEKLQRNYVTILGIFAAIVIAFAAGSTFSSSVLQTMAEVSIYRLSFIVCLLAVVVFNLVFALFLFICRVSKFSEGRYLPKVIVVLNVILLLCMILVFFAWYFQLLTPRL